MNTSTNTKQSAEAADVLPPRIYELMDAFRRLPNPQENRGAPPQEIFCFPEDLPHLHRILQDFYRQEGPVSEDESLWAVPYYAWRALGLPKDLSSVPVLFDCLELCDPQEHVDEFIEFPSLLAAHGEAVIDQAEELFAAGFEWPHSAYTAGLVLDALKLLAEENPSRLARILSMIRARLERYRTNSPLLNSVLIGDLAHYKNTESLPLVRRAFEEDFCDTVYLPWKSLHEDFPGLPESLPAGEEGFQDELYLGDEPFSLALHSAGIQGRLVEKKSFLLGAILHPGSLAPLVAAQDFFFDHFTVEAAEWETEGQAKFLYHQFGLLWNQLAGFQEKHFPLEEALRQELVGIPLGKARALAWFVDEFIRGLTFEEKEPEKGWLLRNGFLKGLAFKMEPLEEAIESEDESRADGLVREIIAYWDEGYLPFAKECRAFRLEGLERERLARENRHVGRNDPCPCGSGKKFKKCCLV